MTFGMTLSDGTTGKAGTTATNNCFNVDETKHISKIDVIVYSDENVLGKIIFYDKNGSILYTLG